MSKSLSSTFLIYFRVIVLILNTVALIVASIYLARNQACVDCPFSLSDSDYAHPPTEYSVITLGFLWAIYAYLLLSKGAFDVILRTMFTLLLVLILLYSVVDVYLQEQKRYIEQYPDYSLFKCRKYIKDECFLVQLNKMRCEISVVYSSIVIVEVMVSHYLTRQEKNRILAENMVDQEKVATSPLETIQFQQPVPTYTPNKSM